MDEKPRRVALPPIDGNPTREAAPPEALRAIAALLGRAAAPGGSTPKRATPPRPRAARPRPGRPTPKTAMAAPTARTIESERLHGDREVPIHGGAIGVGEAAAEEVRRARRRMRRARRTVRAAIERLIAAAPEDLAG